MEKELRSGSGAVFVNELDLKRWEEVESSIILNEKEFGVFTGEQWRWLNNKIVPLINKARKNL